jgi:hypothetical protein
MGKSGYSREKVSEVVFGTFPSGKLRAAGDVAVSGNSGCSTAKAGWNGVSPLSNDLGDHRGIA